jgi:hypothetical protein
MRVTGPAHPRNPRRLRGAKRLPTPRQFRASATAPAAWRYSPRFTVCRALCSRFRSRFKNVCFRPKHSVALLWQAAIYSASSERSFVLCVTACDVER